MASEYTLQLKAMLDTSDVQQKLNQLKQQQNSLSNSGTGNGGVQQALQRLNQTISNLQHSIEKLYAQQGKLAGAAGRHLQSYPFALTGSKSQMQKWLASNEYKQLNSTMNNIGKASFSPLESTVMSFRYGYRTPMFAHNLLQSGKLGKDLSYQYSNLVERTPVKPANAGKMTPQTKANIRMGAGLVFGTIAGGVENYAQATGNQGLATGAGFVKNIGYGAAAGAMVGGPIGAVIGGSVGALNAAFEELARRARETADALEDQAARVRSGRRFDIELKDFEQQRQDKEMMKKQTSGTSEERTEAGNYFRKQLEEAKKKYDNVRANMEKTGVAAEGGVESYEKQTQKLLKLRGKDDEEVKQRQKTADIYKDQFYWLQKHSNRIEQLQGIVPEAQKAREFATSRFGLNPEKHPEIKDWTRYGAMGGARGLAAAEQANSLREALSNLKAPDMANVNSLASQGFMVSAADDEARLEETNKYLRDIANLTRQIKDKETEAATYG